jgi:hypothetical protein
MIRVNKLTLQYLLNALTNHKIEESHEDHQDSCLPHQSFGS